MIELPNNRLILNGHRIFSKKDLYEHLGKKFKKEIKTEKDIEEELSKYKNLKITIWHADTFLKEESKISHNKIIKVLSKYGEVKETGFKKNKLL